MKNTKNLLLLTIISSLFFFCKTKKVSETETNNNEITTTINKKTTEKIFNSDKSKLLILEYTFNKSPVITYNYAVVDAKTKKELKKGVFTGDKIEWLNNNTLKCTPHIGMKPLEDEKRRKDIKNKKVNYITIKIN